MNNYTFALKLCHRTGKYYIRARQSGPPDTNYWRVVEGIDYEDAIDLAEAVIQTTPLEVMELHSEYEAKLAAEEAAVQ